MIHSQAAAPQDRVLDEPTILETLHRGLAGRFTHQRVLVLIPDHTRSLPLPFLFRSLVDYLRDAKQLDFMVALGTHPPLSEAGLEKLVGIPAEQRRTAFRQINLTNHAWDNSSALASIGVMEQDEIKALAGERWHPTLPDRVDVRLNRAALEHDQILIVGPTFPHEVAGFSGGAKYLFPGISGPEMIHATHWLGALAGVVGTIGIKETPVRAMIHAAAGRLRTPVTLAALVVAPTDGDGHGLAGLFIGDMISAWNAAADLSAQRHVIRVDCPYRRVLSCAPAMYDELWTAAKAMYKLEPAVAVGGEVVIHAPHLETVSRVHGQSIYEIGYHILPYFLQDWERFRHVPLGVLAHSTHLRGSGMMEGKVEKPNVMVTLASKIPAEDCARLNLGYLDPTAIDPEEWQGREGEGLLYVPRAGEMLYRMKAD
ncbi:MAG TPA: lactate racemase domain-containing protein [Anaerolineales bacterium]|nr:lactate racemase domain-containing protein [Anaerolineales bacterium]